VEHAYWDAAARLLPQLVKGSTRGPVFVTHRRPGPGKVVSTCDVCPDTGFARLSYGQARALLDDHTAVGGTPGTGWELSSLARLGEAEAIAEVASLLAPRRQQAVTSGVQRQSAIRRLTEPFGLDHRKNSVGHQFARSWSSVR
jgi:hypothetical protein